MKCPRCEYVSAFDKVRCPQCDSLFDAEALEELSHLKFTRDRLNTWRQSGMLSTSDAGLALV
jgi:hypothetical protein